MKNYRILVVADTQEHHRKMLEQAAPNAQFIYRSAKAVQQEDVQKADIIIGNPRASLLENCEQLQWLQLQSAGTDDYRDCTLIKNNRILFSNGSGVYGLAISEFMLTTTLMMFKKMKAYMQNQRDHAWKKEGTISSVYGSTVLILGLGDIGSSYGKLIRLLGGYVIACQLTAAEPNESADEIHAMCDLNALLPRADLVAVCLPGNDDTRHLFHKDTYARMKKSACFLNIGRGFIVNTDDLLEALRNHTIAQAALDVIEGEPLPPEHSAWELDNLILTPHVAGGTYLPETNNRFFAFAAENLKAYLAGDKIRNQVDLVSGCRKESLK